MSATPTRSGNTAATANGHATHENGRVAAPTTWRIDPAASRAAFTARKRLFFVRKLAVTGVFADVEGTITLDEGDPAGARAEVTLGVESVDTGNARRDKHLRAAAFFHAEQHPRLTFVSKRVEAVDGAAGRYRVTGDLTVRGATREVALDGRYTPEPARAGGPRLRLELTTTLNRRDFGLVWNTPIINVADDIDVALTVEAIPA